MKKIIFAILLLGCFLISCKKQNPGIDTIINPPSSPPTDNISPNAKAGPDQIIFLHLDSVIVEGTPSTDPDGSIVSYLWRKLSGPTSFYIAKPDAVKTIVNKLVQGVYQFELTVKDNNGFFAKDTVQITVNAIQSPCTKQLTPFANLSLARTAITTAAAVDIYDSSTNFWSAIAMSEGKNWMSNIAAGNTIFWTGGLTGSLGISPSDKVEIYDVNSGNRTYHKLSQARWSFATVKKNNKILFYTGIINQTSSGPIWSSKVDIMI